jgi:hypothetical protein
MKGYMPLCVLLFVNGWWRMSEASEAIGKLHAELVALGVSDAYEIGYEAFLSVWIGLVVIFRDGLYQWREGDVKRHHLGTDPLGCAIRVARRHAQLREDAPPWWEELAKVLRGDPAQRYP